jgi:hypothetical protein
MFGQAKDTFVISGKNLVVYKGLDNPVQILVEGVHPAKVTVTAPGLTKGEGDGNYIIKPGSGKEVNVNITYKDKKGNTVTEERKYKILPFPQIEFTVNGEHTANNTYSLTKAQLLKLKVGTTYVPECSLFEKAKVKSFMLKVPGYKTVICNGNNINAEALRIINKLSFNGETIIIDNVMLFPVEGYPLYCRKVSPIVIKLIH